MTPRERLPEFSPSERLGAAASLPGTRRLSHRYGPVLLSAYACAPDRGSEAGFGWNWAVHLACEGHDVHVMTDPANRPAIDDALRRDPVPGLAFTYVAVPAWARRLQEKQFAAHLRYLAWQRALLPVAEKLHAEHAFQIVHHVTWGSLTGGSRLYRLSAPFVFGPVGGAQVAPVGFSDYLRGGRVLEGVRKTFVRQLVPRIRGIRRMLQGTDLVLATNTETERLARRLGAPNTALMLDTGLPSHFFADSPRPVISADPLRALWVGRLLPRKAVALSLDALAYTRRPVTLTILGDGPQGRYLHGWIRDRGLDDRVDWRGLVSWEEVRRAYRTHDAFLFNSLRDSFGSQLLEAMAAGLPVVTLNHQGAHDFVPVEAALKVPVTTPSSTARALARSLDMLQANPERRATLGNKALDHARQYGWDAKARRMGRFYHDVLSRAETKRLRRGRLTISPQGEPIGGEPAEADRSAEQPR